MNLWQWKAWEVYQNARRNGEAGKPHPRTLARHGGPEGYAVYHARCYARDILGRELDPESLALYRDKWSRQDGTTTT